METRNLRRETADRTITGNWTPFEACDRIFSTGSGRTYASSFKEELKSGISQKIAFLNASLQIRPGRYTDSRSPMESEVEEEKGRGEAQL